MGPEGMQNGDQEAAPSAARDTTGEVWALLQHALQANWCISCISVGAAKTIEEQIKAGCVMPYEGTSKHIKLLRQNNLVPVSASVDAQASRHGDPHHAVVHE